MTYTIVLTGFIFRDDDGFWNSECHQLDLATCGRSREEVERRTASMIDTYFKACEQQGILNNVLDRLQAPKVDLARLQVKTNFQLRSAHP